MASTTTKRMACVGRQRHALLAVSQRLREGAQALRTIAMRDNQFHAQVGAPLSLSRSKGTQLLARQPHLTTARVRRPPAGGAAAALLEHPPGPCVLGA